LGSKLKIPELEPKPFKIIGTGSFNLALFDFFKDLNWKRHRYLLEVNKFSFGPIKKNMNSKAGLRTERKNIGTETGTI